MVVQLEAIQLSWKSKVACFALRDYYFPPNLTCYPSYHEFIFIVKYYRCG